MKVSVIGKNDKISKKELRYIISFYAKILLGPRLSKNLYVQLKHEPMPDHVCGFCTPIDEDYRKPREFEIEINSNMSRSLMIRTIAHEMVHVYQFARNKLRFLDSHDKYKWNGKVRVYKKYENFPWEKEAERSENYLIEFYKEHLKYHDLKF